MSCDGCNGHGDTPPAEKKRRPPDFLARLHRQRVTVRIPGQPAINGVLTGYTAYEILVTDDRGRDHLIWKGPGLILDLAEDWRTVKSAEAGGPSGPDEPPADQAEFSSDGDRR